MKIELKSDSVPVVHSPRRCPIHLKGEIQSELDSMEEQGIMEKIPKGQPTEWHTPERRMATLGYASSTLVAVRGWAPFKFKTVYL